jgi:hypothetical protein
MILVVSFVAEMWSWLNESVGVQGTASRDRVGKDLCVFVVIVCRPLEGTEFLVQELPRLNFGKEVEKNDPEDDFFRFL